MHAALALLPKLTSVGKALLRGKLPQLISKELLPIVALTIVVGPIVLWERAQIALTRRWLLQHAQHGQATVLACSRGADGQTMMTIELASGQMRQIHFKKKEGLLPSTGEKVDVLLGPVNAFGVQELIAPEFQRELKQLQMLREQIEQVRSA